jgi:LysM repeat protein
MEEVHIVSGDGKIDIRVPMGDGPAIITGGLGGWQIMDRLDDIGVTDWIGQGPLTQDVPLLLDGYAEEESVLPQMRTIFKLGRDVTGNESVPPVFQIEGPIFFPKAHWVLPEGGIELDPASTIFNDHGDLLRQAFTLHLLEFVRPDVVRRRQKRKKKRKQGKLGNPGKTGGTAFPGYSYTVQKGDTLTSIAANLYGDWKEWKAIGKKNGITDPNRKLPPGKVLKLPR